MRKPALPPLVYTHLFPAPKASDPASFQAHITRNIVQEVRAEISCYYGPTDCLEAQYPGLDYVNPAHRSRLARYTFHRRLFRVFDELRLTDNEIRDLCRWEGTRSARERYEEEHRCLIRDTTWDDIEVEEPRRASAIKTQLRGGEDDGTHVDSMLEDGKMSNNDAEDSDKNGDIEGDDSEDELQRSIGVDLNRHLLAATAARARGEQVVLDAEWEQWLKEAAERGASEAASLTGVGSARDVLDTSDSYGQQIPPIFRSNSQQHIEVLSAPHYAAYSATTSSAPPTGTAI